MVCVHFSCAATDKQQIKPNVDENLTRSKRLVMKKIEQMNITLGNNVQ